MFITASNFIEMLRFGITRTAIIRFLSGAKGEEKEKFIGSNWLIGIIITLLLIIIIWSTLIFFPEPIKKSGFNLFFTWYPILSIINIPFNNALSILQADQKFNKILIIRLINVGTFVIFLALNLFFIKWGIINILYAYLIINLLTSVISILFKWSGLKYIFKATRATNKIILNYGKYTTGTLIGSNLLKSSDSFIIGLSPILGTTGVALYSIPLKLTEILEIPIRSFIATAFPIMSKASIENKIKEVKKTYYTYSGATFFLLLPLIIICLIFAEKLVILLGGNDYAETANIFRIFCIYGLFLPLDKFTGVTLDSINRPKKNFFKVIYMTSANIIGDLIAVFILIKFFPDLSDISILISVSSVTVIMILIGLFIGFKYLNKEINLNFKYNFKYGLKFYKKILRQFLFKE